MRLSVKCNRHLEQAWVMAWNYKAILSYVSLFSPFSEALSSPTPIENSCTPQDILSNSEVIKYCFNLGNEMSTSMCDQNSNPHWVETWRINTERGLRMVLTGMMAFLQNWQMSALTISPTVFSWNLWGPLRGVSTCSSLDLCSCYSGYLFCLHSLKIGWYLQFISVESYMPLQATLWLFSSFILPITGPWEIVMHSSPWCMLGVQVTQCSHF